MPSTESVIVSASYKTPSDLRASGYSFEEILLELKMLRAESESWRSPNAERYREELTQLIVETQELATSLREHGHKADQLFHGLTQ